MFWNVGTFTRLHGVPRMITSVLGWNITSKVTFLKIVIYRWMYGWRRIGGMILTGKNRSTWTKSSASATLSTTNLTWTDLGFFFFLNFFSCLCFPYLLLCIYYITHNTQTSMLPAEFEPAIPASERPQTLALDRSATGIGIEPGHPRWEAGN